MIDSLQAVINNFVNSQMDQADQDIRKSISKTNKKLISELKKMYISFIEQFYKYETRSYVRHGTSSPGTQTGYALKRPQLGIHGTAGRMPSLVIDLSGGYIDEYYEYADADEVFDLVSEGIRFTGAGVRKDGKPWEYTFTWDAPSYSGKYFSYHSTIREAFDSFNNDFEDIAMNIVRDELKQYGWR